MPDGLTESFREKLQSLRQSVKADYLKDQCFSKFVSTDTAPAEVRRTRAITKWLATERENEATNDRLIFTPEDYNILPRVPFGGFVDFCRDLVIEIIGDTVPVDALIGAFSGGASTSRSRTESHPAQKYLGKAHVTQRALDIFLDIVDEMPGWLRAQNDLTIEIVPGNVLFTVPKKTDIDRCACKEPDINMFLQKGVGNHFRDCLRRIGINLNDQSINSSLARKGSLDGSLATLDLSSASDSVSSGLVALLLPECWYTLLDSLRSPVTIIDGETHRNEMFSSMGNGFTFELESLLFYVLTRATCYFTGTPGIVSVYGDDIICPTASAEPLIWVLSYFGFSTNVEKSHMTGPFRESCGGHFYDGFDITPFYIKGPLLRLTDVIDAANKLRRWGQVSTVLSILDPEVEDIWLWLKSYIPSYLWGGEDLSFKYQLVSYDVPKQRLQSESKRKDAGHGGYLHWLNATWDRSKPSDGVSTSSYLVTRESFRLRNVRTQAVPRLESLFISELR
jgi:hypothetical protein